MDHYWSQIFQKHFLKVYGYIWLQTSMTFEGTSYLKPGGDDISVSSAFNVSFPFILFLSPFLRTRSVLISFLASPSLLISTTQQYLSSYVQFWRSKLSKLLPKTQSQCDLIQNKRCHSCDVFTPQPNTIRMVLQLGIEYPPRDPGWCYPKVWEVFTGFPRGTVEPQSHFLLPPSQERGSWLPNPDSKHSQQGSKVTVLLSLGLETPKFWDKKEKKRENPFFV